MKYLLCAIALAVPAAAMAEASVESVEQGWSLPAVVQRVVQANRDLQSARRAVDAARADLVAAGVTPPAQFSLLSQSIDPHNLGSGGLWNRPIDTIARIDKPVERGDKATWRQNAAQAGLAATQQDQAEAKRLQVVTAAQAYWDLKLAQEQLSVSEHNLQLAQESSHAAQLRLAQGDLSRLEATRLAVEADRAANEQAQARTQLTQARANLAWLLNLDNGTDIKVLDAWPAATAPDNTTDDDAWLAARADVQAAAQRLEQARAGLALAQSQRSTDVTLSVQFEHNPAVAARLWGVGVAFPLGVDGRQDGPVARALVAVDEAQAQLDKTRAAALVDRAVQRDRLTTALQRVQRIEAQLLPQARDALKGAEFARQQGALPLQDVLDARRALHAAELDAAQAHADAAKAWSALTMTSDMNAVTP